MSIVVLHSFRPLNRILKLYDLDNFRGNDRRVVFRNLFESIGFTILLSSMLSVLISAVGILIELADNLIELAHPLSIWLCVAQQCCTYSVLLVKEGQLSDVINLLQEQINARKLLKSVG